MERFLSRALLGALPLALPLVLGTAACGDDTTEDGDGQSSETAVLAFEAKSELFPGFSYDTGLQPEASPVQASFQLSATGDVTVHADAAASGSAKAPVLTGVPGSGLVSIHGGFALIGTLKVELDSLPVDPYEGPIPGIENVEIAIDGEAPFEPFAIGEDVVATADIPAAELPGIPLPAGIPGTLVLSIAEGSFVEVGFSGTCAGIDGESASYSGAVVRAGTLVIRPKVVIEVPLFDPVEYEIPEFVVDLALGGSDLTMEADVESFGAAPEGGDALKGKCDGGTGEGGGNGAGGAGATSTEGSSTDSSSSSSGTSTSTGSSSTSPSSSASSSTGSGGGEPEYLVGLILDGIEAEPIGVTSSFEPRLIDEGFTVIDSIVFSVPGAPGDVLLFLYAPEGVGTGCPGETYLSIDFYDGDEIAATYQEFDPDWALSIDERSQTRWAGSFFGVMDTIVPEGEEPIDVQFSFDFTVP